ncbi:MAG: TauD/TfdA dioxygenase family protein [Acidimicrobiales bacterium]
MTVQSSDVVLQSGVSVSALGLPANVAVQAVDGPVGAIVEGIDLADDLDGDQIRALIAIWNNAGLMILRGQDRLTAERQAEMVEWFGRRFHRGAGPDAIDHLPMVGELPVQLLSNRDRRQPGKAVVTGAKMAAATQELKMHSDVQDYAAPPDLTTLHGIDIPPPEAGGRTYFWDLFAAYDTLEDATRAQIRTMRWRPRSTYSTMKGVKQPAALANDRPDDGSAVTHPVVRTHPSNGRKALWISTFTETLLGFDDPTEERALRRRLLDHVAQEQFRYTHTWQAHDVLFWDNRSVNHARDSWDGRYLREMHRAQSGGSVPF